MYLTKEEERMLAGEMGDAAARAIDIIVKIGDALGADRLVKITHAHVSGVSYFNIGDFGLEFIEDLARSRARFTVFTTANPYAVLTGYADSRLPDEVIGKQIRIVKLLKKMGTESFTCTPYYIRRPSLGEHLAWAESSAVLYANSVIGARTNREPGPLALLSGIVGRTYLGGAHIGPPEEVKYVVNVERPTDPSEAGAYGLLAGDITRGHIPLIRGLEGTSEQFLKEFLAAFATTSPSHIAVIEGVTPGCDDVDSSRAERISLNKQDIIKLYSDIAGCRNTLFLLGCPHLSASELKEVLAEVGEVKHGELWLTVGDHLINYEGYGRRVRGLKVLFGACAVTTKIGNLGVDCVVTDSAKALAYIPRLTGVRTYLVRRDKLLKMVLGIE